MKKETAYKTPYGYFYNGKAIVREIRRSDKIIIHWTVGDERFDTLKKAKEHIDNSNHKKEKEN